MQENAFQTVRNQKFSRGACPRTHLDGSHAFGARPPNLKHLPTALHGGVCRKLGLIDLILPVCVRVCEIAQVCNPCWKEVFVVTK